MAPVLASEVTRWLAEGFGGVIRAADDSCGGSWGIIASTSRCVPEFHWRQVSRRLILTGESMRRAIQVSEERARRTGTSQGPDCDGNGARMIREREGSV